MTDDKEAAEGYRRQRQAAVARKSGFSPKSRDEQFKWMDENAELILSIIRGSGVAQGDEHAFHEKYKEALLSASPGSPFDDINGRQIVERVIREIERACHENLIPIRSGVVYGISPELGLLISQSHVMQTDASIIEVTAPFIMFCNLISKALAKSLPQSRLESGLAKVSNDPSEVQARLQQSPLLVSEWTRIIKSYAVFGWPPPDMNLISEIGTQVIRIQLLRAIELFAFAHEYGHHAMLHGITDSSVDTADSLTEEHQADIFARGACLVIGSQEKPPNFYAMSGSGGVITLGTLDLVRRAKSVLESGDDQAEPRERHPHFRDRVAAIALLDDHLPPNLRAAAAIMRDCFVQIIEVIWALVRPGIAQLHAKGVRPMPHASDPGGWLPT